MTLYKEGTYYVLRNYMSKVLTEHPLVVLKVIVVILDFP